MAQTESTTNVDSLLESIFEETTPCEMPMHSPDSIAHEGDGNWYMAMRCPKCSASHSVIICDKFRNFMLDHLDFEDACGHCKANLKLRDTISSMVRRG